MKVGSLVECINDKIEYCYLQYHNTLPVKSKIYTVRSFNKSNKGVYLEEIVSKKNEHTGNEQSFKIGRFIEVLPPMEISIENLTAIKTAHNQ